MGWWRLVTAGYDTASGMLIAAYGETAGSRRVERMFVDGPAFSICHLCIGPDHPVEQARNIPRTRVDFTKSGGADYGSWAPPLLVPPYWWMGVLWELGFTSATSTATANIFVTE